MKTEEEIFNELKALLANYPEQRVDLEEVHRYTILAGKYQVYNEGNEGIFRIYCATVWQKLAVYLPR